MPTPQDRSERTGQVALEPETFTVTAITEGWPRAARTEVTREPGA